jgi:hypothetical protein
MACVDYGPVPDRSPLEYTGAAGFPRYTLIRESDDSVAISRYHSAIPDAVACAVVQATASDIARFGRIDRRTFDVCSWLDVMLYFCYLKLVNGYLDPKMIQA